MESIQPGQQKLKQMHTRGHINCSVCAGARTVMYQPLSADLLFPAAFDLWIQHREIAATNYSTDASYLSATTIRDYTACARALRKFFAHLRLEEIHAGHLREYQRARAVCDREAGAWTRPAGANRIRKEAGLLLQILRAARCWGEEQELCYQPLRHVENDVPRAMSPDEQRRFLMMAASRERWQFIYWYSMLALRTTASTNELRALRLGDLSLAVGVEILQVRREGAKNRYRIRTIPLETDDVLWAIAQLMERARGLGSTQPHHYLFPFRIGRGTFDATRPMTESGLKKLWAEVREAAELGWLRPYDLRHTAITRMAEAGTPIQVIMAFAGHMTLRMQQHYTAISMMAKRHYARLAWGEMPAAKKPPTREAGRPANHERYPGHDAFYTGGGFSA